MTDPFNSLLSPLYASASMRAIMSDQARLQRLLDFEAALARAEAAVGIIPASAAVAVSDACRAELYDLPALMAAVASSDVATVAVEALTAQVASRDEVGAGFVHWGATSQDAIDTALVLELRAAIDALLTDLEAAIKAFTSLAGRHRRALLPARIQLQHALPMSLGLKLAGYAAALARSRDRLARLRREALVLQFGGTAGTLASYGEDGLAVAERLAALLDLPVPEAPWHSHRDRLAEVGSSFAILAGTCGKIARDVALMMQIEVGELAELAAPGETSWTRERNPAAAAAALSAAAIAPNLAASLIAAQVQEHERGLGGWQSEWTTIPMLALVTSGAVEAIARIAEGIEIDVDRMRANLEFCGDRIMAEAAAFALAQKFGRAEARSLLQELTKRANEEGRSLKEQMLTNVRIKSELTSVEIEKLFIPLTYQGSAQLFIDRLVFAAQPRTARRSEFRTNEPRLPSAPQLSPTSAASHGVMAPPASAPEPLSATPREAGVQTPEPPADALEEAPTQGPLAAVPEAADRPPEALAAAPDGFLSPSAVDLIANREAALLRIVEPMTSDFAEPEPAVSNTLEPAHGEASGALMDVLSRAEVEDDALGREDKDTPS